MVRCRACCEKLPSNAKFCGYCGFRLSPLQVPAPDGAALATARTAPENVALAKTLPAMSTEGLDLRRHGESVEPTRKRRVQTGEQARRFRRFPVVVDVTQHGEDNFFTGVTENISAGGLFVTTDSPAQVGELLEVSFTLPGLEMSLSARCVVRWIRAGARPDEVPGCGMGLGFVELDPAVEAAIEAFINHREPVLVQD